MEVAGRLGLETMVRIIVPYGRSFGARIASPAEPSAWQRFTPKAGPSNVVEREESFPQGQSAMPRMYYRVGAKKDGSLHCLNVRLYLDTGPYDHLGGVVMALGLEHSGGPYRIPNAALRAWCVYTNNPIGGAFRGFGVTQVTAAIEQMMDMLAIS
jgi:CO/xanthine dehydrogenase Mo-binding subunit